MKKEEPLKIHPDANLARERVEKAKYNLAKAINLIEASADPLEFACDRMNWNNEIVYQMKEGATTLGMALATLVNWYSDEEEAENGSEDE